MNYLRTTYGAIIQKGMLLSQKRLVRRTTKNSLKSLKGNEGGTTETKKEKYKFNVSGKNKMGFLNFDTF